MFAYITGELVKVAGQRVVLECAGIGYDMLVPQTDADELAGSIGADVKIHTFLSVREDGISLFGFLTEEELDFFKMLINVSGIGPKGALGILSSMTVGELRYAILAEDAKTISKAPGIGAKTASKLVIELKDKINIEDVLRTSEKAVKKQQEPAAVSDAIEALVALGYSQTESLKAVNAARSLGIEDTEELIKAALKQF